MKYWYKNDSIKNEVIRTNPELLLFTTHVLKLESKHSDLDIYPMKYDRISK